MNPTAPKLKCKSHAELMRICRWLEDSGMAWTCCQSDLEIQLGNDGTDVPGATTLNVLKAGPAAIKALEKCEEVIGMARQQGKLSNSPLSPVNTALMAARAVLDEAKNGRYPR